MHAQDELRSTDGILRVATDAELDAALDRLTGTRVLLVTGSPAALRRARRIRPEIAALLLGGTVDPELSRELTRYGYINNPDGTIRWLFDADEGSPLFLALQNAQRATVKLFRWGARVLYGVGLKKLVRSGTFHSTVSVRELLHSLLGSSHPYTRAAFFTGTVGEDRKVTVALAAQRKRHPEAFLKVPLTEAAAALVRNEAEVLEALPGFADAAFDAPRGRIPSADRLSLLVSSLSTSRTRSLLRFTGMHADALASLYRLRTRRAALRDVRSYADARRRVERLSRCAPPTNGLVVEDFEATRALLERCLGQLDAGAEPVIGWAHGDFTPWNSFVGESHLRVYDWELARPDLPLLHDLFHYVLQAEVLVRHSEHRAVLAALRKTLGMPEVRRIVQEHHLDANLHLGLYLLFQASLYSGKFVAQDVLHPQANWLMACWRGLLDRYVGSHGKVL